MDSNPNIFVPGLDGAFVEDRSSSRIERIIEFYEESGADYEVWSRDFNMHVGFYRRGLNPFDREKMLEQMNLEIAARLQIASNDKAFLLDLGCGFGAVSRTVAKTYPNAIVKGVTLSPLQVETSRKLNARVNLQDRIEILRGDYTELPFKNGAADGVWAIESACYADGAGKEQFVCEMARVLKPGGRFVIADCFIKRKKRFNPLAQICYSKMCRNWALREIASLECFVGALRKYGFRDIVVEDIYWQVAPSMVHAPFAVVTFFLKKFFAGKSLNQQSINNLKASLLAPVVSLSKSKFSYYLISGAKN